jgi:formylmethanofuran dehydrogenase subunit C
VNGGKLTSKGDVDTFVATAMNGGGLTIEAFGKNVGKS